MTKLLILSDLHLEERPYWRLPDELPVFDVAVFAGDIAETPREAVKILATAPALAGRPIVYVPGNHEFFSGEIEARLAQGRAGAMGAPVTVLDRETVVLGGVRFVGSILWTDYALNDEPETAMEVAARGMWDHRLIRIAGRKGEDLFEPRHALARHQGDLAFIEEELAKPFAGPTVVVTHHAPHRRSVHEKYADSMLSAAFASDLTSTMVHGGPDVWIYGHTHLACDYRVGATRVVSNPKGYGPKQWGEVRENIAFDETYVIEV